MESSSSSLSNIAVDAKDGKECFSSEAGGTLDSSRHSIFLDDSMLTGSAGSFSDNTLTILNGEEPLIRQLRHSGTAFASDLRDRVAQLRGRKVSSSLVSFGKKQRETLKTRTRARRVEDRFASHMNSHQTREQLAKLRESRRSLKTAIVVEETSDSEDDSLDRNLALFWQREQTKSVHYVTSNLHYLVLIGDEEKAMTFGGHQFMQVMPNNPGQMPSVPSLSAQ